MRSLNAYRRFTTRDSWKTPMTTQLWWCWVIRRHWSITWKKRKMITRCVLTKLILSVSCKMVTWISPLEGKKVKWLHAGWLIKIVAYSNIESSWSRSLSRSRGNNWQIIWCLRLRLAVQISRRKWVWRWGFKSICNFWKVNYAKKVQFNKGILSWGRMHFWARNSLLRNHLTKRTHHFLLKRTIFVQNLQKVYQNGNASLYK